MIATRTVWQNRPTRTIIVLLAMISVLAGWARAEQTVYHPFVGVTYTVRTETTPRPLTMYIVDIDLAAPGVGVRLTPQSGTSHTIKQTTLDYLTAQHAQIAVNAHFFEPWPAPSPDPGTATLVGIAASDSKVYAPFMDNPPKQFAIRPNAPGINIDAENRATVVHRNPADPSGYTVAEAVTLHNTLAGNEQIVTGGKVSAADNAWNNRPSPRTAVGLTANRHLLLFVVDGRQPGVSEGLTVPEMASLLATDYSVTDAINMDGGGSATLAIADPAPRIANVPVGVNDVPGTTRAVGSNLAIFARSLTPTTATMPTTTATAARPITPASSTESDDISATPYIIIGIGVCLAAGLAVLAWRRRSPRAG